MSPRALLAALPLLLLWPSPARAHFQLQQPADWLQTDSLGNPLNGSQKVNPCGNGTASGVVTTVVAGSTLHIKLTETIAHGGHYRIALLPKINLSTSDIPDPAVTLDSSGQCSTAAIESPVVAPVLADNLFPHDQATAVSGQVWETDVQIPASFSGQATLQIIEFMTPHPPQCFYHHCAQLQIVSSDAGSTGTGDGGGSSSSGGASGSSGSSGGSGSGSSSGAGGVDASTADASGGSSGGSPSAPTGSSGGCSLSESANPGALTLGVLGAAFASALVRRRRR